MVDAVVMAAASELKGRKENCIFAIYSCLKLKYSARAASCSTDWTLLLYALVSSVKGDATILNHDASLTLDTELDAAAAAVTACPLRTDLLLAVRPRTLLLLLLMVCCWPCITLLRWVMVRLAERGEMHLKRGFLATEKKKAVFSRVLFVPFQFHRDKVFWYSV